MTNSIGIMQGRLSPRRERLQSFPWREWREEFGRAQALGFEAIEWLFDAEDHTHNPMWSDKGISEIRGFVEGTGIKVPSVCATFFLAHPFFRVSARDRREGIGVLTELVQRASELDVCVILVPVLEAAEIRSVSERAELLDGLSGPLEMALTHGITLALETELVAYEQVALLTEAGHPALGIYYDSGNATARGYDIASDILALAPFVRGVHIKDRPVGGPNVPLGTGDADFTSFFPAVRSVGYDGPLILETTPGDDYHESARRNLEFVRSFMARIGA